MAVVAGGYGGDMPEELCNELLDDMDFHYNRVKSNHRNPSKHRIEEHLLLNWIKHNRKLMNSGKLKESRVMMFKKLLEMGEKFKRVNQWK